MVSSDNNEAALKDFDQENRVSCPTTNRVGRGNAGRCVIVEGDVSVRDDEC